jgi:nitrite reductase/ring-hydroxylating ferredoxin subunit
MDTDFVPVCRLSDLPSAGGLEVTVQGRRLAVFKTNAGVFATDAFCPHRGAPLWAGCVEGHSLFCPLHGWEFDIRHGYCRTDPERPVAVHQVKQVGEEIFVRLGSGR